MGHQFPALTQGPSTYLARNYPQAAYKFDEQLEHKKYLLVSFCATVYVYNCVKLNTSAEKAPLL